MTTDELFSLQLKEPDGNIYIRAKKRFDSIAKPIDGFGDMEDIVCRIAAMTGTELVDISKKALIVMCADNGVVEEGVSQTDPSVTASVASLLGKGKSTVCVMAKGYPVDIIPIDVGIDSNEMFEGVRDAKVAFGTRNITRQCAMTEDQCLRAICVGIDAVKECADNNTGLVATGEMGIGNTTTSAAVFCAITGRVVSNVAGRGAGLSDDGMMRKVNAIEDALLYHGLGNVTITSPKDAFSILSKVGGLDIAALAGVFIGCAIYRIPAVIDGAISAVAALTASYLVPGCEDYMIASHKGRESITGEVLDILGLKAVIDADMALGEGTGALMLLPILDMVTSVYRSGTMFSDTDITEYERFDK